MKKYRWAIILLNLILLLFFFNYSIIEKERLLSKGQLVLLELAPVDPRSLMQGDYMRLRYKISEDLQPGTIAKRGYCVVRLNNYGVASRVRFQQDRAPLQEGEYLIGYRLSGIWNVHIGAESYFFQEGEGEKFEKAKYGGVKIDKGGNSLLVGLYDDQLRLIE